MGELEAKGTPEVLIGNIFSAKKVRVHDMGSCYAGFLAAMLSTVRADNELYVTGSGLEVV